MFIFIRKLFSVWPLNLFYLLTQIKKKINKYFFIKNLFLSVFFFFLNKYITYNFLKFFYIFCTENANYSKHANLY